MSGQTAGGMPLYSVRANVFTLNMYIHQEVGASTALNRHYRDLLSTDLCHESHLSTVPQRRDVDADRRQQSVLGSGGREQVSARFVCSASGQYRSRL